MVAAPVVPFPSETAAPLSRPTYSMVAFCKPAALVACRLMLLAKHPLMRSYFPALVLPSSMPNEDGSFEFAEQVVAEGSDYIDAGITANVIAVTENNYYDSKVPNNWLEADLAVTNWASRPDPQAYLDQLYKSGADYNEAHFSDPDLDKLIVDINLRAQFV